jgi:hypothetical protein
MTPGSPAAAASSLSDEFFRGRPLGFPMGGHGQIEIITFFLAENFLRRQFSKRDGQKKKRKKRVFL